MTKVFYGQGKKGIGSFIHVSIAVGVFLSAFDAFTHYSPSKILGKEREKKYKVGKIFGYPPTHIASCPFLLV